MNNIIIEEYIIGAENIEVRYYIDGKWYGKSAFIPNAEYEKWAVENEYFGEKEMGCHIEEGSTGAYIAYVNLENYTDYWRGWVIEEHLTQYLTENPAYMTAMPLYCKLWYSLCTWCANAFGSPQIR